MTAPWWTRAAAARRRRRLRDAALQDGVTPVFNSARRGAITQRLVHELEHATAEAKRRGERLDAHAMIFAFTDPTLADALVRVARAPEATVRILTDFGQLSRRGGRKPPVLAALGLPTLQVRFKKDLPYVWDDEEGAAVFDHRASRGLNHHKGLLLLIGGRPFTLVSGSFNWSPTAEHHNFENVLVLEGRVAANRLVMRHFEAEFEAFWNDGRVALTLDEARDHRTVLIDQLTRRAAGEDIEATGLTAGAGDTLDVLAPRDLLDVNAWNQDDALAAALGAGDAAAAAVRAMRDDRIRAGRFEDWDDLLRRVPSLAERPPDALATLRRESVFGSGQVAVNADDVATLRAAGASRRSAEAIVAWRTQHGDFESLDELRDVPGVSGYSLRRLRLNATDAHHRIAFSARRPDEVEGDGGFAKDTEARRWPSRQADGSIRWVDATLGAGAVDIIHGADPGDTLLLATYGLSLSTPEWSALATVARRGARLRVVLNAAHNDRAVAAVRGLAAEGLDVELFVCRRTMHEKFLVHVEGPHVFNGSANLSTSASRKNAEDRFFFKNTPALAAEFTAEFERLVAWVRSEGPR